MRRLSSLAASAALAFSMLTGPAAASPEPSVAYEVVALDGLGGNASFAIGIDDAGLAVGTARTSTSPRPQLAVRWDQAGTPTELGTLEGSTFSRAFAVNGRGETVGEAFTPSGASRAVTWTKDGLTDFGAGVANDINARGQVAGVAGGQAIVWEHGRATEVGTLSDAPQATSRGNAINERGQLVGSSQTDTLSSSGFRTSHAFVATPRGHSYRLTDIGSLAGDAGFSVATAINARGEVVGESVTEANGSLYSGFRWRAGELEELAPVDGRRHSIARDINARGDVVGYVSGFRGFATIDGLAVLWQGTEAVDLNTLVPADNGWVLRAAEGINARGQIVGFGSFEGETRAFRLDPVS